MYSTLILLVTIANIVPPNTNGVISIEKAWSPDHTDRNKADRREKGTMMQAETKMKKSRQDQHN